MASRLRTGATAAAVLPSALAAALLVSAPFAGTTTSPLADSHTKAAQQRVSAAPASGLHLRVPTSSVATMGAAEALLLGVGVGVIVVARRRSQADRA